MAKVATALEQGAPVGLRRHSFEEEAMTAGSGLWGLPALVHQATGMVMAQLSCSADEAVLRIIDLAEQGNRSVLDVAQDIVERRARMSSWTAGSGVPNDA